MQIAHLRHGLVVVAALAGLPAFAAGSVFPGTLCTSEGATEKGLSGLMVNKVLGTGTTNFYCPIIHSKPLANLPGTLTISVNVKTASNVAAFDCWVRSVQLNNVNFDQVKLAFPTSNSGAYYSINGAQLSMPGQSTTTAPASVNMRCLVPNVIGGVEAGIVSYRIEQ